MQLTFWSYEGPPHIGAMRVATGMKGLHYVLHAPQGDTYADLLFTMIERRGERPPVTYTTFQDRHLGSDTAGLFKETCLAAYERFKPEAMIVGASCTAELLQDDPGGLARALGLPIPVIPLELPAYQRKENWGAAETFYQLCRALADRSCERRGNDRPLCNILGPTALGFRHRDDVEEVARLLAGLGIDVNVTAPLDASPRDFAQLGKADFNVVLYPETAETTARWLEREFGQPWTKVVPIGARATRRFVAEVANMAGLDPLTRADEGRLRLPWYSRSVDSNYLTGKRVFVFGDATHAIAAARVAVEELGFKVVGLGTYAREQARQVRSAAAELGIEPLITDDYLQVEAAIAESEPELVLGTQMERHIAKRLGVPCAMISAPMHVQDFPARYAPQMGFEGANVLFDSWVHPLMMGLEEHLLSMFKEDFEFRDGEAPSHLGGVAGRQEARAVSPAPAASPGGPAEQAAPAGSHSPRHQSPQDVAPDNARDSNVVSWTPDAEAELKKIPFFVRRKARRNAELFAAERGITPISVETLYDAKAHFSR